MKKTGKIIITAMMMLCMMLSLTACGTKDNNAGTTGDVKHIEVMIYDSTGKEIYDKKVDTEETFLYNALMKMDDLKIEATNSGYGEFITSINGVAGQGNYYWNYYVNGKYSTVGVSTYEVQNNDNIKFILERYEGE